MPEFILNLIVAAIVVTPILFLLAGIASTLLNIQKDLQRYRQDLAERHAMSEAREWITADRARAAAEEGK